MSLPKRKREYFEYMYADNIDPWDFETSWYEQRKYAVTVASLPHPRYTAGFEPGCSIGVLTDLLSDRCETLLSADIIPAALDRAKERMVEAPHVRFAELVVPDEWPDEQFDLIVLSEVASYLPRPALKRLADRAIESLNPGGVIEAVHYRDKTELTLSAEDTHAPFENDERLNQVTHHEDEYFVIDIWTLVED